MNYNQNNYSQFVPLRVGQKALGAEVIMEARGQEQGVILCDLGDEFVTWRIYRHDDWKNPTSGNYFMHSKAGKDPDAVFEDAKADFLSRVRDI